jgi:hypothetical protein
MENTTKYPARVFFALWPNDEELAAMAAWQAPFDAASAMGYAGLCAGAIDL